MIPRRTWIASAAATAGAAVLARRAAAQTATVRMATSPAESYAQPFFAQDAGIFAKYGIDAQIQTLANGASVLTALAGGVIDVGVGTIVGIAAAVERGVPFVMLAPAQMTTAKAPTGVLCVEKTSTIQTGKDLESKPIAVPALRQIVDLAILAWMDKNGGDSTKAQLIETHFPDMGPGLDRGTFAAACISEPSLSYALSHNNIRQLANPFLAIAPEFTGAGWITTKAYQQKNPELTRKIAEALLESGRWANTHREQTAEIVSRVTKIPVETIRNEIRPLYAENVNEGNVQIQLDTALKYNYITHPLTTAQLFGRA